MLSFAQYLHVITSRLLPSLGGMFYMAYDLAVCDVLALGA